LHTSGVALYQPLWRLVRPYRGTLLVVLLAMLVQTAMGVAAPWPLKVVVDNVVGTHKLAHSVDDLVRPFTHGGDSMRLAAVAAIATVVIALLAALASYVANYYTTSVGQWVANDLRLRTYHHLQQLSLHYYDTHETGSVLSTITDDVQTIQSFASSSMLGILVDLLTIVAMVSVMLWVNFDFSLLVVAVTPFMVLLISRLKTAVKKATRAVRKEQSQILAHVQQGLEVMRAIKAYGRQDLEQQELSEVSHATVTAALKARSVKALVGPIVTVTIALCTAFVLWRSSSLILRGAMTIGALTVFLSYLRSFFKPVRNLATMTNAIAQTAVSIERVSALLEADDAIPESAQAIHPRPFKGDIEFEHVAFSYVKDTPVLRDVNFKIGAGQMVGIVGPTGSGKSTVVSLIPRFYDLAAGALKIDGTDVRSYALQGLRGQIGYVLQETVLFRGTIADNIGYGRSGATRDEIVAAAKQANADEFIAKMPQGYDTMVGERGETLSGGQRQRIGIARALVRDNPILILDEPTAALDTESEQLVVEALARLMKGRTVITIAHRLSTIRAANKIVVIKDGVVAEEGSHDALLSRKGVYADLYRMQFAKPSPATDFRAAS